MKFLNNLSTEEREYVLNLPYHLTEAGMAGNLCEILAEFEFIEYKISASLLQELIEDYDFALALDNGISEKKKRSLKLIQGTLRLSENVVLDDKTQLSGQLWGRLQCFKISDIKDFLIRAAPRKTPWLRPLTCSLTPPEGSLIRTLVGHNSRVTSICVTSDGKLVISGARDNTLKVWNLETGKQEATLIGHNGAVLATTVTLDCKWVISGSVDHTLKVWSLETGEERFTLRGHNSLVSAVAVTCDGKKIISGSQDQTLKIWNLETGEEQFTLAGHESTILAIAVTPDAKWIVSGSDDQTLKVWNLETGKERFTLRGHNSLVSAVAVTFDSKQIISGSGTFDSSLKLWNLETGEEVLTLRGHRDTIFAVSILPGSKQVFSASEDGSLKGCISLLQIHQVES
jgi:WD40 repeat protein